MHSDYETFCLLANALEGKKTMKKMMAFVENKEKFAYHRESDFWNDKHSEKLFASVDQNVAITMWVDNKDNYVCGFEAMNFDTEQKALFVPDKKGAFHLQTGEILDRSFGTHGGKINYARFYTTRQNHNSAATQPA